MFDYGNRLREATGKEKYRYDGHGRRVYTVNTATNAYSVWQYSSAGQLMYSHDARNNRKTNYIYLGGSLLAQREIPMSGGSTVTIKYQHTDALGTSIATTDSTGTILEKSEYEPYGQQVNVVGPPKDGPGYTGHVQDAATGLTYMQQRYYDPAIGRTLSVDPVTAYGSGDWRQFNRYAYAFNNPYRFTDPDGRQAMGSPNDMANPVTIEQSADVLGWISDGLEVLDQVFMSNPYASFGRAATMPLARMAKPLAAEAKAASALARAKEIQGVLNPRTQRAVTTAVAETEEGIRVVGSSEGALRPAQRAALKSGEIAAKGARGTHAEVNAVNGAKNAGLTPTSVSPSRPACVGCQDAMKKLDIPIKDK